MKQIITTVCLTIAVTFFATFSCMAEDDVTTYSYATGGHASYEGEALAPGESEVFGSAGLYDDYVESSGTDSIIFTSGQSAYAEIDAEGGETSGTIEGAGQQESSFTVYREAGAWDDAYAEGFAVGSQSGEAGFLGEAGSESEPTTIYGEGTMTADVEGYVYNTETEDGYRSEVGSFVTQVGVAEIDFESGDVEDGYAYTEGLAEVRSGSYAGADFGSGSVAIAYSYGEAELDYRSEAGVGTGGIAAEVTSTADAATEGYSEVWQEGGSIYSESWHRSTASFGGPTSSEASGSVGGLTAEGFADALEDIFTDLD
jgi:hypothetical protein